MNKKFFIFAAGILILFTLLTLRLVDVQIIQGQHFLQKAENNRFYTTRLNAPRGILLDRYGDPLVWNTQTYYQDTAQDSLYGTQSPLNRDDALKIMASSESASIVTGTQRLYRYPDSLAHVVGYVGAVSPADLRGDSTLNVSQQIGKTGLELTQESELRGQAGDRTFEINAVGQKLREVERHDPVPGHDVTTTIDPYVNEVAAQALGDKRGAAIVTDAATGQVLALTSRPTFDPNLLSQVYPDKEKDQARKASVQQSLLDPNNLFLNRAVSGAYPTGSIFKVVNALTGLEDGSLTPSTVVDDQGEIKVGPYVYGNWYFREYGRVEGPINLERALTRSNDIYFYKAAEWSGPDKIATMARVLGLGDKTGIELPAEARGLVPDPGWKERVKGEKWFLGDTYHFGIGQGDLLTTPIQIAQMTQALANNGSLCKMTLTATAQQNCRDITVKPENLNLVLKGMVGACSRGGTAFPFFPYNDKRTLPDKSGAENLANGAIACKTGTAEFGAADARGYRKTHALFTSIVEVQPNLGGGEAAAANAASASTSAQLANAKFIAEQSPDLKKLHDEWLVRVKDHGFPKRLVITVLVESDDQNLFEEGSTNAAPIAKQIIDWIQQ